MSLTRRALGGLALGAGAALAGCATDPARTLRVSFAPLYLRGLYEAVARAFQEAHPGLHIELDGSRNYEDLVQKTLREAIVDDLPDVSHQAMAQVRILADRGLALPLDSWIAADPGWSGLGYLERLRAFGEVGGKTAALPFALSTPVVFFNTALVAKAGGDPAAPPTTWAGILDLARRIRDRREPGVTSLYFDYASSNAFSLQSLIFGAGGAMTTPDERRPALDGPQGRAAMRLLAAFREAGQVDISREQASQAFGAGALGIFFSASSSLRSLREQAGDRFGVAMRAFPISAPGGKLPAAGNALTLMTRDPARQQMAWSYIRFVLSPEIQTLMARRTGYVPVSDLAIRSPRYLAGDYARDADAATAVRQLPDLTGWYAFPGANSIRITQGFTLHMQDVITGRASPDAALAAMSREATALMAQGV